MTFTEILKQDKKEVSAETKLSQLAELVSKVRTVYGNKDIELEVPYIPTIDGTVSMKYLDAESKLALAERAIKSITIKVTETCEVTEGLLFDKEVERLVAIDGVLANLLVSTGSQYI